MRRSTSQTLCLQLLLDQSTVAALVCLAQAVFDLPKKMRAALEGDMLDTAVSFYAEAQPLLAKYGNRGAFRQIAAESQQVAKEMAQVRAG